MIDFPKEFQEEAVLISMKNKHQIVCICQIMIIKLKVSPEVCNGNPDSTDFLMMKLIWVELKRGKLFQKNKKEREREMENKIKFHFLEQTFK